MTENKDLNIEFTLNEIEKRRAEIIEKFDLKYGLSLEIIASRIQKTLIYKYNMTKETVEDASYEAVSKLLNYIYEKKDLKFDNEENLYSFMYTIAIRKAFELISRRTKFVYIENYQRFDDLIDASKNVDNEENSIEILLKNIYDGTKNIDVYLSEQIETLKLMELFIIDKLSYKEIVTLEEYSHYKEATLRKKVERGLKKYKQFIKD